MKLAELAVQYRDAAALIKDRLALLKTELETNRLSETEKFRLHGRIALLESMYRDTTEAAVVMERYYDRRYKRNERYSV